MRGCGEHTVVSLGKLKLLRRSLLQKGRHERACETQHEVEKPNRVHTNTADAARMKKPWAVTNGLEAPSAFGNPERCWDI